MLFLSVICAVVPVAIFVLIFALVVLLHLFKLSMVLSAVALVVFLLFYFIYLKFAPDQGILIVLYPVLAQFNLHYMIPLVGAMAFNLVGTADRLWCHIYEGHWLSAGSSQPGRSGNGC